MKISIEVCDFCKKPITKESGKNGFCAELGYSIGGWGTRRDVLTPFSVEVCDNCFGQLKKAADEFAAKVTPLKR